MNSATVLVDLGDQRAVLKWVRDTSAGAFEAGTRRTSTPRRTSEVRSPTDEPPRQGRVDHLMLVLRRRDAQGGRFADRFTQQVKECVGDARVLNARGGEEQLGCSPSVSTGQAQKNSSRDEPVRPDHDLKRAVTQA